MNRNRSRKTWDQTRTESKPAFLMQQPVAKVDREYSLIREDIPPGYGEYLSQLERKNKEMKELNQNQDPKDQREEGFNLYFNGTHAQKVRTRAKTDGQVDGAKSKPTKASFTILSNYGYYSLLAQRELRQQLRFCNIDVILFLEYERGVYSPNSSLQTKGLERCRKCVAARRKPLET